VRELPQEYFSSNRARTSSRSRGLLQAARVLSNMRPDEPRDSLQVDASIGRRKRRGTEFNSSYGTLPEDARYKCYVHPSGKTSSSFEDVNGANHPRLIEYEGDCGRTWERDVSSNSWREVA